MAWSSTAARASDFNLTLGSGQFIPGFEDQLIGAKAGEQRDVKVTFPADYQAAELAGKDAVFDVTVKEIKAPDEAKIDDELAKKLGLDDLATLKDRVRDQVKADFAAASRLHLKRRILDALDNAHAFPLPPAMVEAEFDSIWAQVEAELKREGKTAADEGKTEDELKAEYHAIAERRVRLGLVLGKLGEQNGITIAGDEVNAPSWPAPASSPARSSRCSSLRQQPAGPGRDPRAHCSRTRWWISSPNWPRSPTSRWTARPCSRIRTTCRKASAQGLISNSANPRMSGGTLY